MRVVANWPQNIGQMAYFRCSDGVFPTRATGRYARREVRRPFAPSGGLSAQLSAAVDVELPEDVGDVGLDGHLGDEHPLPDLRVGEPLGDELSDPGFGGGERGPAVLGASTRAPCPARPLERILDGQLCPLGA